MAFLAHSYQRSIVIVCLNFANRGGVARRRESERSVCARLASRHAPGGSSDQLICGPGPPAASSTAARHSRLTGRIGGIGAKPGSAVGAAIDSMFSVCDPLRMKIL